MKFSRHEFKLIELRKKIHTSLIIIFIKKGGGGEGMANDVKFPFLGKMHYNLQIHHQCYAKKTLALTYFLL